MAKSGQAINPEDRRYVRSFVAGRDWSKVHTDQKCVELAGEIFTNFPDEWIDGTDLQTDPMTTPHFY